MWSRMEAVAAKPKAGWYLTHPVTLLAIAVLVLNDHLLKERWPGLITGKLSDLAGLAFFPLLLLGALDLAAQLLGKSWSVNRRFRVGIVAVLVTAVVFASIQLSPWAEGAYVEALAVIQWPYHALAALLQDYPVPAPRAPNNTADPTDLVALVALLVPLWLVKPGGAGARR